MQRINKELALRLYGEAKHLSAECKFAESVEILQKAFYHDPTNNDILLFLSRIYMCLKCYHQAYYNLIPIYKKDPKALIKASCKIARFETARSVLRNIPDSEMEVFIQKEEKLFKESTEKLIEEIGAQEMREMFMSGGMIECKVPHLPNNNRNPLPFVGEKLRGKDIELRLVGNECYGLFAKKDFSVNEIVLEEIPYVIVNADIVKRCFHCCQPVVVPVKCSNVECGMIYCSEYCEKEAQNQYHKPLCGINIELLVNMAKTGKSSSSRYPLMCWKILGRALVKCDVSPLDKYPSQYDGLSLLYRHSFKEDYMMPSTGTRLYTEFQKLLEGTRYEYEPYLRVEWLIDCSEMLILNAIGLGSDDILEQSPALLLISSFFNHSDKPNCSWSEDGNKAIFRAKRQIKENEQIFISYGSDDNMLKCVHKI
jgi:hypothetical protein